MTKISDLINRIDKDLDSGKKEVYRGTYNKYKSINEDLKELIDTIMNKGITDPRQKKFDIIYLVREIFVGKKAIKERAKALDILEITPQAEKLDIATGGEDDKRKSVIEGISKLGDKEEPPKEQEAKGLKIMTPSQLLTRLPILLAQKQAGNTSQKINNRIIQIIYSLYRSKNLSKTIYNHLINSI